MRLPVRSMLQNGEWTFEGGQPASFRGQHPGEVTYATAGDYEVILKVTDEKGRVHTRFAITGRDRVPGRL